MNGPASLGTPIECAKLPITPTKFGPATAPKVVITIVILTAVALCFLSAKSVPA
ncbi:Uncharacterised protein [Streptococcus pneumoniae]|nr:Uncharacterised protein [Streptococcus pneumoniae]